MLPRMLAGLSVVMLLTAFAPAPFPKPRKERAILDDRARLQGSWKVVGYERPGLKAKGAALILRTTYTHVRIEKDQWSFQRDLNGQLNTMISYSLTLDPAAKKMEMTRDLGNANTKYFQNAIYRFKGDKLEVMTGGLYATGGAVARKPIMPELSFDNPPTTAMVYTLERDR